MSQRKGEQQLKDRVKRLSKRQAHTPSYADIEYKRHRKRMRSEALARLRQAQERFEGKPTRRTKLEELTT